MSPVSPKPCSKTTAGPLPLTRTYRLVPFVDTFSITASENDKKQRSLVTGHFTDVLVKDGGRWQFIAWAGGDYPKK
jgi:hypothetical protein